MLLKIRPLTCITLTERLKILPELFITARTTALSEDFMQSATLPSDCRIQKSSDLRASQDRVLTAVPSCPRSPPSRGDTNAYGYPDVYLDLNMANQATAGLHPLARLVHL